MGTVSISLPADGETIDAADYNTPLTTITNEINGQLDNNNIKAGAAIDPTKLASSGFLGAWTTWTPTFANFTKGSATVNARYIQIGKTVHYSLEITLSGSTMGSNPTFSLPVATNTKTVMFPMGVGYILDNGTASYNMRIRWASTTTVEMSYWNSSATGAGISSSTPMTWANGDSISINGTYEAA